jgi:osmoprotectant transport system permease protein
MLLAVVAHAAAAQPSGDRPVIVASKPFGESFLLAEMLAQLLEHHGIPVDRRPGLGATEIAFSALRADEIDVYPEYTGTGLLAILGEPPRSDPDEVYARVAGEFERRFGVRWLPPLGFSNSYAIAVRRETAEQYGLRTLSDLARVSPQLVAGFTPDFIGRPDGLPGLEAAYGIRPRAVRALLAAVKYQALAEGRVDVIDGYETDGFILRYDLVVLLDDRGFFPAYDAAAIVGPRLARDRPDAIAILTRLSARLTEERMRALNERIEVAGEPIPEVARSALRDLSLLGDSARAAGESPGSATARRRSTSTRTLAALTGRHLLLVGVSLGAAILLTLPLGLALDRVPRAAEPLIRIVGAVQTIPGIALLAFMIPLLGIGVVPALVALLLYSIFPILRNTYTGIREADPNAVNAARALGMTDGQLLRHVRLPLAAPVIMAGIRTAAVINVGTATLAAFIGAGGLGDPIVTGLALSDTGLILSGALPAAALALLVDVGLGAVERRLRART